MRPGGPAGRAGDSGAGRVSDTADRVIAAWRSMLPVRKSAAVAEDRAISEAVIRAVIGAIDKHIEQTMPVLEALRRSSEEGLQTARAIYQAGQPGPHQVVDFRADQWHTRLVPNAAPPPANGHGHPAGPQPRFPEEGQ